MIQSLHFALAALVSIGLFGVGIAPAKAEGEGGVEVGSLEAFQERRAVIEENFADGGAYMEISGANRRAVRSSLELMEQLLSTHGNVEVMNPEARIRLYNEQETVNEILTAAARDSRLRCERRGRVGTRFKSTVCETYAERQRRREEHQALYQGQTAFRLPDRE